MSSQVQTLGRLWTEQGGPLGQHDRADWGRSVRDALQRGRAAWPQLTLDDEVFVAALVQCVTPSDPPARLAELELGDLYLATACATGDEPACASLMRHFRADVEAALRRFPDDRAFRADVSDEVFAKLLVPSDRRPARIADYRGRGGLGRWIRVTTVRTAVDRTRGRGRRESPASDGALLEGLDAGDDPELRVLKDVHRAHFRAAFEHAVASLSDRDRRLLRERTVFGLGIVQIADLHATSKSTAARWLTAAREKLVEAVHAYLAANLDVSPDELRSLLELATTGVDISVARLLETRS